MTNEFYYNDLHIYGPRIPSSVSEDTNRIYGLKIVLMFDISIYK